MIGKLLLLILLSSTIALKISPMPAINSTNQQSVIGVDIETWLETGSKDGSPWLLLFKKAGCPHCQTAQMLFNSFYIEINKRRHFQPDFALHVDAKQRVATVNCDEASEICNRFNIQQYPTYLFVEPNGQICQYQGGRMPQEMMTFLQEKKLSGSSPNCRNLGRLRWWSRFASYFEPLKQILDYNVMLFIVAFIIGPFLFGFIFSRNKQRQQNPQETLKKD